METAPILQDARVPTGFTFNNGGLHNFKKSNKIKSYVVHGEEGWRRYGSEGTKIRRHRQPFIRLPLFQYLQLRRNKTLPPSPLERVLVTVGRLEERNQMQTAG
ncbi:hypothetical protein BGZ94_005264, partial [Podila epigama]